MKCLLKNSVSHQYAWSLSSQQVTVQIRQEGRHRQAKMISISNYLSIVFYHCCYHGRTALLPSFDLSLILMLLFIHWIFARLPSFFPIYFMVLWGTSNVSCSPRILRNCLCDIHDNTLIVGYQLYPLHQQQRTWMLLQPLQVKTSRLQAHVLIPPLTSIGLSCLLPSQALAYLKEAW